MVIKFKPLPEYAIMMDIRTWKVEMVMKRSKRQKRIQAAVNLYDEIYRHAFSRVKDEEASREIAQNVIETVLKKIDDLKKEEALKQWVMSITATAIKDHFRELSRLQKRRAENRTEDGDVWEQIEDVEADLLTMMENKEDRQNIIAALFQLDKKYREVIKDHVVLEKSFQQIAGERGIPYNTVKTRYQRGIRMLKEKFLELQERGISNDKDNT